MSQKKEKKKKKEKGKEEEKEKKGCVVNDPSFWEMEEKRKKEEEEKRKMKHGLLVLPLYEMKNGFIEMGRDCILRICSILWNKIDDIRKIIGMCGEFYNWTKHKYFVVKRPQYLNHFLHTHDGTIYKPDEPCFASPVFLSNAITEGVFRWTVQIKYSTAIKSFFQFGSILCNADLSIKRDGAGDRDGHADFEHYVDNDCDNPFEEAQFPAIPGGCFFRFGRKKPSPYYRTSVGNNLVTMIGVKDCETGPSEKMVVLDNSRICLEIDAHTRRLSFFVGDDRMHSGFSGLDFPVVLGIWSSGGGEHLTSKTFIRIPSNTPFSVCRYFPCREMQRKGRLEEH